MKNKLLLLAVLLAIISCKSLVKNTKGDLQNIKEKPTLTEKNFPTAAEIENYADALLLYDSYNPANWLKAEEKLYQMKKPELPSEEKKLMLEAKNPDAEISSKARLELARHGKILKLLLVYYESPPDQKKWQDSRRQLVAMGDDAIKKLLDEGLVIKFFNPFYRYEWEIVRKELVEIGNPALERLTQLVFELEKKIADIAENTRISEGMVQCEITILAFGEKGEDVIAKLSKSQKWQVRKTVATTLGKTINPFFIEKYLKKLLLDDDSWQVRAESAISLSNIKSSESIILLKFALQREKDPFVLDKIKESLKKIGK